MRHLATTGRFLVALAFLAAPATAFAQDPGVVIDTGVIQFEYFDNGEVGAFADAGGLSFGTGLQYMGSESGLYEGTFLVGGLLIARVDFIEFTLPTSQIAIFAVLAIVVGIVAAIFPARRAARLNPLEALQYE